ncbi:MlaD family protein [Gordonia hydrophobica]|uniref:MlaD family protein n=1 Tax=Gordonia hydrophobica TaxID=40516 RepID=A0ABZ2TVK5_9ACTN|nr:MlaD family protein [Gordonia hydrophobica]MBM7366029.1 phospholipid/cholesterol/gamma-HCH transport system substrate-binding protein [Gordonia hydrophobica]
MRAAKAAAAVVAAALVLVPVTAGCSSDSISTLSAIGAPGTGADAYEITALIPSAAGLVRNAPVMMRDATVGSIGDIVIDDWRAKVTLRLNGDVKVPVGSHAMIGMTSVLGSSHIAIVPPDKPSSTYLSEGGSLALPNCPEQPNLPQTGPEKIPDVTSAQHIDPCMYPTTEQVLSSLSVVLNGGGLSQMGDVVNELGDVFGGNEKTLSKLIPRLNTLVTDLNKQTTNIIGAMDGLDRLSATINAQTPTVQRALESGPRILQLLVDQRKNLVNALDSVGKLSATANQVLKKNSDDIKVIVPNLRELMEQLSMTGPALSNSLRILLTFPFLEEQIPTVVKGDYVNSDLVLDLTWSRLNKTMLASVTTVVGPEVVSGKPAGAARGGANPYQATQKGVTEKKQKNPGNPSLSDVLPSDLLPKNQGGN